MTVCLLGLGAVAYVLKSLGDIDRYEDLGVDAVAAGEPRNYLVVGSDSRANVTDYGEVSGQRSDTIMVVRLDPKTKHADVLSIPRDLLVTIAGTGETARINSAYSTSRQTLIDTLRDNFNIEINHYIEVDFAGFQQLVDAVGGVPLFLDRAIKDDHSGLFQQQHGCVTLNGEQALAFARSRHLQVMTEDGWSGEDPFADLGRIQRQQVFMRRAVVKAIGAAKSNPLKLRELVDIGVSNVGIDAETDPLSLANEFKDFDPNDLTTYSIPVLDSGDGATVVRWWGSMSDGSLISKPMAWNAAAASLACPSVPVPLRTRTVTRSGEISLGSRPRNTLRIGLAFCRSGTTVAPSPLSSTGIE